MHNYSREGKGERLIRNVAKQKGGYFSLLSDSFLFIPGILQNLGTPNGWSASLILQLINELNAEHTGHLLQVPFRVSRVRNRFMRGGTGFATLARICHDDDDDVYKLGCVSK